MLRQRRLRLLGRLLLLMQLRQQVQKGSVCGGAKTTAIVQCPSGIVLAAAHASAEHARGPTANPASMQVLRLQALAASKKAVACLLRVLWLPEVGVHAPVASGGVRRPCSAAGQPAAGAPDAGRSKPYGRRVAAAAAATAKATGSCKRGRCSAACKASRQRRRASKGAAAESAADRPAARLAAGRARSAPQRLLRAVAVQLRRPQQPCCSPCTGRQTGLSKVLRPRLLAG
jgi:hypothetical protein